MPGRKILLKSGEVYHVFNRGIAHQPTFTSKREYQRALLTLRYYQQTNPPVRLSYFLTQSNSEKEKELSNHQANNRIVQILSYCLMPNHFHLLMQQLDDKGISKFLSYFQNSYTRYYNTSHKRDGSLFLGQFKAVRIETDDQLLHVNRYIQLNLYTSYLVKELEDIVNYPWSSMEMIMQSRNSWCNFMPILDHFKSKASYKSFVLDQADYQRSLKNISHLLHE